MSKSCSHHKPRYSALFAILPLFLAGCPRGELVLAQVIAALGSVAPTTIILDESDAETRWVEASVQDGEVPLTVDVMVERFKMPRQVVYLLPASGTNARASFFAPAATNLARFYVEHGYLVVGITPREDQVAADGDHTMLADAGVAAHRRDVRRIIRAVQKRLRLPYDLVGHSFTSAVVLDYAAHYDDELRRIGILDFYHLDPREEAMVEGARTLYQGFDALAAEGVYADTSLSELASLIMAAAYYPDADSGMPRSLIAEGMEGNFTFDALLHFWMVYTAPLPGVHTHITGLPRDWPLVLSTLAGTFVPGASPSDDTFALAHVGKEALLEVSGAFGSGTLPLALMRDCAALSAYDGSFAIDWSGIDEEVVWVNAELGYADMMYATELIREAGNPRVRTKVVQGYGNADVLYAKTAATEVWGELLRP